MAQREREGGREEEARPTTAERERERPQGADRETNGNSCGGGGLLFKETEEKNSVFSGSSNTMRPPVIL